MSIDINKKYRTRDGREVRIHADRCPNPEKPLVVSIQNTNGTGWWTTNYTEDGFYTEAKISNHDLNLIEVREPREFSAIVHKVSGVCHITNADTVYHTDFYEPIHLREVIEP